MPDLTQQIEDALRRAAVECFGDAYAELDPLVQPSNNPKFGDYQANLAMPLAKRLGQKPREVAEQLIGKFDMGDQFDEPTIAGPGFINLTLRPAALGDVANALQADERLGVPKADHPQTVVIDYSSPNVAKEMHVGHLRSTVIGDALARVLAFQGHNVIPQNHFGDWGTQFGRVMLGLWYEAAAKHLGRLEWLEGIRGTLSTLKAEIAAAQKIEPEVHRTKCYFFSDAVHEVAEFHRESILLDAGGDVFYLPYVESSIPHLARIQELYTFASTVCESDAAKTEMIGHPVHGSHALSALPSLIATFVQQQTLPEHEQEKHAWEETCRQSTNACQDIYDRLNVLLTPDDICSESFYNPKLPGVIERLQADGAAVESEGALVVFVDGYTDREGEPLPMIVRKSDGGYLYATTDFAAAQHRIDKLNGDRLVYVVGSPQRQHFEMLFASLRKYGWADETVRLDYVPFGSVLGEDGKMFKTRSGETVRLVDLIDEAEQRAIAAVKEKNPDLADEAEHIGKVVGIGALKYADLSSDRVKDYKFSWDRMLALEGNTAPYLINAYVRIRSIFRKAELEMAGYIASVAVAEPNEKALVLKLMQFGPTVASVAESLEPHRLCNYLYDLASAFHKFYEHCPVLRSDVPPEVRASRLALCKLVASALEQGLDLLGIGVVERM